MSPRTLYPSPCPFLTLVPAPLPTLVLSACEFYCTGTPHADSCIACRRGYGVERRVAPRPPPAGLRRVMVPLRPPPSRSSVVAWLETEREVHRRQQRQRQHQHLMRQQGRHRLSEPEQAGLIHVAPPPPLPVAQRLRSVAVATSAPRAGGLEQDANTGQWRPVAREALSGIVGETSQSSSVAHEPLPLSVGSSHEGCELLQPRMPLSQVHNDARCP